jgi:hypothetical protein
MNPNVPHGNSNPSRGRFPIFCSTIPCWCRGMQRNAGVRVAQGFFVRRKGNMLGCFQTLMPREERFFHSSITSEHGWVKAGHSIRRVRLAQMRG